MQLQFPFPSEVRNLYLYKQYCCLCNSNGNERGGLELHHVLGRVSDSAFNSAVLCKVCHDHIGHSRLEHHLIFSKSFPILYTTGFKPLEKDLEFLRINWDELISPPVLLFIKQI